MNFTLKMFSVWPVSMRVFSANSGYTVWMLTWVSSLPEARSSPLRDQLFSQLALPTTQQALEGGGTRVC